MKTKKMKKTAPRNLFFIFLFFLIVLFGQYIYVAVFPNVYGIDMKEFAANRNVYSSSIYAKRGSVYDVDGNVLALDVTSYRVIAYLDASRTGSSKTLYHVVDKEGTAEALASVLGGEESYYLDLLNPSYYKYQTYLGSYGNNITESKKMELENLNLPGIDFEESYQRYYPNGDFSSYNLGYAKKQNSLTVQVGLEYDLSELLETLYSGNAIFKSSSDKIKIINNKLYPLEEGTTSISIYIDDEYIGFCNIIISDDKVVTELEEKIYGELGIESYFDTILRGTNGYLSYQADRSGYKIPDTEEERIDAITGSDVYLTLDSTIQRMLESSVKEINETYLPEWITFTVMDAKSGDILGSSSTPTFNPNDLNTISNYENPLTSFVYEPGSVMKIFTYMCAIENGVYNGDEKFKSGTIDIEGDTVYDWNRYGWGEITYDIGFTISSNVGVSYMMEDMTGEQLNDCFKKYGFNEATGIDLPREMPGQIEFTYPYEIASASFGQGITTTAIQQLQALSIVANDGDMVRPNIIDKIVSSDGSITEYSTEKIENVVTENTTDYIKSLMYKTVHGEPYYSTGYRYKVDGLDVIGKTGTAQVYNNEAGTYIGGGEIYSFSGMFPYEDPEIIVFASVKKPTPSSTTALINLVQPVLESVGKYKGLIPNNNELESYDDIEVEFLINKNITEVVEDLTIKGLDVIVLGDGNIVTKQYPSSGTTLLSGDKIYLTTNGIITIPDLTGFNRMEVTNVLNLLGVEYEIEGIGFVSNQTLPVGSPLGYINVILSKDETVE